MLVIVVATEEIDGKRPLECREWLPSIGQGAYFISYIKQRAPETSKWIYQRSEYIKWKGSDKGTLWINGGAPISKYNCHHTASHGSYSMCQPRNL